MNNIIQYKKYNRRKGDVMEPGVLVHKLENEPAKDYTISQSEDLAREVLKSCEFDNISGATPIVKIATNFGFLCLQADNIPDDISGNIFVGEPTRDVYNNDKVIIVGSNEEYNHQRFIIAHELAHYFLDYIGDPKYTDRNLLFSKTYPKNNHSSEEEVRADRFAAELLMPSELFLKTYIKAMEIYDYNKKNVISYLSTFFKTKRSSIERRINEVIS